MILTRIRMIVVAVMNLSEGCAELEFTFCHDVSSLSLSFCAVYMNTIDSFDVTGRHSSEYNIYISKALH